MQSYRQGHLLSQAGAGAHVGPGLQDAPEVTPEFLEGVRPEGALASLHALLVEVPDLL